MANLLTNRIKTPDGTILESRHIHDYKTHIDTLTGEEYMVDGGLSYLRRSVNKVPYQELSIDTDTNFETIRDEFTWGTYGKEGKNKKKYVALKDLTTDHIQAILITQKHIPKYIRDIFETEYARRQLILDI